MLPATIAASQDPALTNFLATAPASLPLQRSDVSGEMALCRLSLCNTGIVSCVRYNGCYWITLADISRITEFRLASFGRRLRGTDQRLKNKLTSALRKLDARNESLKVSKDSSFLQLLRNNDCVPTSKEQKVFAWFAVPFDELLLDILEDDLKAEDDQQQGRPCKTPLTEPVALPATTMAYARFLLEREEQVGAELRNPSSPAATSTPPS
ncbi:hypothetical protein JCM11251_001626, partial [Rhodosporidiobolus azoricus]